ncbi:MAG: hypothetical protein V4590_10580 [Bacteroidota bacterium]
MEDNIVKLGAAQLKPFAQNTEANRHTHIRLIALAAKQGVALLLFLTFHTQNLNV